jgi:hypothetical protein
MRRKLLVFVLAVTGVLGLTAGALAHVVVTNDVKECTETTAGEKTEGVNDTTDSGIVVAGTDSLVTVTVPEGITVLHVCVKTGESEEAVVSGSPPYVGPTTFTVTKTGPGGGISHLEFGIIATPTPTPTPSPTPTPEPTPTPTPEPTPTPTPEPTPTPTPEPTPTPAPEPTPSPTPTPAPTPPPSGGGGAGGGGGGAAAPAGELPFTGLPVLFPLIAGGLLLAAGLGLWRRGRND